MFEAIVRGVFSSNALNFEKKLDFFGRFGQMIIEGLEVESYIKE